MGLVMIETASTHQLGFVCDNCGEVITDYARANLDYRPYRSAQQDGKLRMAAILMGRDPESGYFGPPQLATYHQACSPKQFILNERLSTALKTLSINGGVG